MVIREVVTNSHYGKVCEYLKSKGLDKPNSVVLLVAQDGEKIIGVTGFEYVPIIEPMAANSGVVADKLYNEVLIQLRSNTIRINNDRLECYISDNRLEHMNSLLSKKGFNLIEKTNRFVKNL